MAGKTLPSSAAAWLSSHGAEAQANDGLDDLAALVRAFQSAAPKADTDPFSQDNLNYLTALLDTIGVMDECLYEHYRALIDLFREGVFRAPRGKLLAYPSWNALREKAVHLGLLPAELYGHPLPHPHVGTSDAYFKAKGGNRK